MALVLGVNAGFVTVAPSSDPAGDIPATIDDSMDSVKDDTPVGAIRVTEIGWWCDQETEAADYEVGIYSDNGADEPHLLLSSSVGHAKGTSSGWKTATGLDLIISPETTYWIAIQLDNTSTLTSTDFTLSGGSGGAQGGTGITTLAADWGSSSFKDADSLMSIYAITSDEAPPSSATDNMTIIGENVY